MRYPTPGKLQKTLRFEPLLRVDLPAAARDEAISVLAALMVAVLGESDRGRRDGGSDE